MLAFTVATLCIHGYHPLSEDGGLYVAGIEYLLDRSLFPHYTAFVQEHLRFSLFAPTIAGIVRLTHTPLLWTLFALYLFSIWLTLFAARNLARAMYPVHTATADRVHLAGIALFAAWLTLPIAGTSLWMMDPYLTARSFSTPLTLLAIAFALKTSKHRLRNSTWCALCVTMAAVLHPLMAAYALVFVITTIAFSRTKAHTAFAFTALLAIAVVLAALVQLTSPAESPAFHAAVLTRYYWFLSQWQWYEWFGVIAPLLVFAALLRFRAKYFSASFAVLCRAAIVLGAISIAVCLLFARENLATHRFASLQPLRLFLPIYAVMAIMLGASMQQALEANAAQTRAPLRRFYAAPVLIALAAIMCFVQRQTYTTSPQVELPWRISSNPNPWVQAFLWARANTPRDALFALDAKYINRDGEDAQTFRATAQRSALPDYSKDGGEAAITPSLAPQWAQASAAQNGLSRLDDRTRSQRLAPFQVNWLVLQSSAATTDACPYDNGVVKVCRQPLY